MERRYTVATVGGPRLTGAKRYRIYCYQCGYQAKSAVRRFRCPECGTQIIGR